MAVNGKANLLTHIAKPGFPGYIQENQAISDNIK